MSILGENFSMLHLLAGKMQCQFARTMCNVTHSLFIMRGHVMSKIAEDIVITYSLITSTYCETTFAKKFIFTHFLQFMRSEFIKHYYGFNVTYPLIYVHHISLGCRRDKNSCSHVAPSAIQ